MKCDVKFSMSIRPDPGDEELLFARQLGIPCVYTWVSPEQRSYDSLARLRERTSDAERCEKVCTAAGSVKSSAGT